MFTNILVASDGSEHAERALRYAARMAAQDHARLHVAHVAEKLVGPRIAGQDVWVNEEERQASIRAQAATIGAEFGVSPQVHIIAGRAGHVAIQLAAVADEVGADLIVAGTRGHSAVTGLVLGSVTQHLLHEARCAVLAVPPTLLATETEAAASPEPAQTT